MKIETHLPSLASLPDTYGIYLSEWSAIAVSGEDRDKYLQGQVTCDVINANDSDLIFGAHCDAKGKTLSAFRLIKRGATALLLQPKSSLSTSLTALQKYGVFAKVSIQETTDLAIFTLVGERGAEILRSNFQQIPDSLTPVIQVGSTTIVYFGGQQSRYLLIDNKDTIETFFDTTELAIYPQSVWDLLEINEGFPILNESTVNQYVPQMLNIQAIHGISFTKGCYLGQETIARMQYLGKNKRALYALVGSSTMPLNADDVIEIQMGENWRKAGDMLASYRADDGTIYLQAVLSSDIDTHTHLRLRSNEQPLSIVALPYSLT